MIQSLYNRVLNKIFSIRYLDFWYTFRIKKILSLTIEEKKTRGIKRTVRLISNFSGLWQRTIQQTPKKSCQFGSTLFVAEGEADYYVILNTLQAKDSEDQINTRNIDPKRIWGLHMEPDDYINEFNSDEQLPVSRFYTNSVRLIESGGIYRPSPPYVHFLNGKSWDFLQETSPPVKKIQLGIIASDLKYLEGHKARWKFLEELDASDIDCGIWGRGESLKIFKKYKGFLLNKWDMHSMCRYSIVIENSKSPLYWTEKVADALLGFSLPLYYGAENLNKFIPENSFIPIDILDKDCIEKIRSILKKNPYDERYKDIQLARKIILEKENIYAFLNNELEAVE